MTSEAAPSWRERVGRALTFYFFFTVPGLVTMFVLGLVLWVVAPFVWPPIIVWALVRDLRERRRGAG